MGTVTVRDAAGRSYDIDETDLAGYQSQGFTRETPTEHIQPAIEAADAARFGDSLSATLAAGTLGALGTVTGGLSDAALAAAGGSEGLRELQALHPIAHTAGAIAGAFAPVGLPGLAADAGAAIRAGSEGAGLVGGIARAGLAGAAEGAIYGAGQGVSDLALSQDPLTLAHAAATLSSNMLYGAAAGAGAGAVFKGAEIGLSKARRAVQDVAEREAAAQDLVNTGNADLADLDAKGLRAARDAEQERLAQEQTTQRTAARSSAVDDMLAYRQTVKDANPWLVITEGEPSKQLSKANNAIRAALDDPKGLRESPGPLLKPLRIEEQALQNAVDNRAAIAAKLDEVNAKIAGDLEGRLTAPPTAAPAPVTAAEAPPAAGGRIEVHEVGRTEEMRATMADGSTRDLGKNGADAFLAEQMPEGFRPAKVRTHQSFVIEHGLPTTAEDVAKIDENGIFIARPSELAKRDLWGNELKDANRDSVLQAWKDGKKLPPVDAYVTLEGRIYVEDGNHRIQAAARDGDRLIAIRFKDGTNYDPQHSAREIGDRIRADLPPSAPPRSGVPSTPTTWREFQASKMAEYMKSEGGHAGAMKRLAGEWKKIKAGRAPTAGATNTASVELTGKAARRYATYADVKVPKGGSVTLTREEAQGFLDALKSGQVQGESRAALDKIGGLLEQNQALQARIKEAAAPLKPRAELTSERLTAIDSAKDALSAPKVESVGAKLLGHVAYGATAGAVGAVPLIGHVLGPVVGAKVADAVAGLTKAATGAGRRSAAAASAFLGKASGAVGKAADIAPPIATKVLADLRYGEPPTDERGKPIDKPDPKTLPELFKARADEIKSQVQIAPDGTYQMRPAARQKMAARLSGLGAADPIAADRLESAGALRITWLASQLPRRPDLAGLPVGPEIGQLSDAAMRTWTRKAAAVEDPYGVLARASAGSRARVVPEEIMALRAVHPALLNDYITQVIAGLPDRKERLPYAQRLSLSMLTGRPLDPAMTPSVLREIQGMHASEPGSAGGTMAPRSSPQFGSVKRSDSGTPAQRRQGVGL